MRRVHVEPLAKHILDLNPQTITLSEDLKTYRWLLKELRVSVFAQAFWAKGKVPIKRVGKWWRGYRF